ncbi:MAG TPA: hypothetical protein VFK69_05920, partial [Candidatus Eisenbacteria bacterium]|nr:hypothetical protein [Candidatus Eisenbacteria bacterium]
MARGRAGRTRARGMPHGLPALVAVAALAFAVFLAHGVGYVRPGAAWGANANAYLPAGIALA